jgi:hypothetical protein
MKRCWQCRKQKPLSEFPRDRSRRDGRNHRCTPCNIQYCRDRHARNRDEDNAKSRSYSQNWRSANPVACRRNRRQWRDRCRKRQEYSLERAIMRGKRWTPEEDALVLAETCSDLEIALSLGRSFNAVKKRRAALRAALSIDKAR